MTDDSQAEPVPDADLPPDPNAHPKATDDVKVPADREPDPTAITEDNP